MKLSKEKHYRIKDGIKVAWYFVGMETETRIDYNFDEESDGEEVYYADEIEVETGMAKMVMVGDDSVHLFDPDDIEEIDEEAFCRDCGQIGCGHNTYS